MSSDGPPGGEHPRRTTAWPFALAASVIVVLLVWTLVRGEDRAEDLLPPAPAAPAVDAAGAYDWRTLPIGGGGFVTGIVAAEADGDSVVYARTDVGGAYRWNETSGSWTQMLRTGTMADGEMTESDYHVASIAVSPADPEVVVLAAGWDHNPQAEEDPEATGRVLWSTDGGSTWRTGPQRWAVSGSQRFRTGSESLALHPLDPERALLGTQRQGLWETRDGGQTWKEFPTTEVPDGLTQPVSDDQAGVSMVALLSRSPGAGDRGVTAVVGVAGRGIYVSADDGLSWQLLLALDPGEVPSSPAPAGADLVFSLDTPDGRGARLVRLGSVATGDPEAVEISEMAVPASASRWHVTVSPHDPSRLALTDEAMRDGHLWTSTDSGTSWTSHDLEIDAREVPWLGATDLTDYMSAGRLLFDPVDVDRLWFAEGMGVWRTDEPFADPVVWSTVASGIEEVVVSGIVVAPEGDLFVTVADRQGFRFGDLDHIPNRTLVDRRFASGASLDYSAADPSRLAWVGAESQVGPPDARPRGAVSDDGGETWHEMAGLERAMYGGEVAVSATDPDRIVWLPTHARDTEAFRTEPLGLYVSVNGGWGWSHVSPDGDVGSFHRYFWWFGRRALAADRVNGDFYLQSDEGRFYRSDDGGETWALRPESPPCTQETDCHVYGQLQAVPGEAAHLWASTGRSGLHRSADAGATRWDRVAHFDEARAFGFGAPVGSSDESAIFVYGRARGEPDFALWRSVDGGVRWELVAAYPGGLAAQVHAIAGDPDRPGRVYVGFAGSGVVYGDDPALR